MTEPTPTSAEQPMDVQEARGMEDVVARLSSRFPDVAQEVIEAAVRTAHDDLDGPVRDFVPVLVEHAARDRIASFADRAEPSGPSEAPVAREAAEATQPTEAAGPEHAGPS